MLASIAFSGLRLTSAQPPWRVRRCSVAMPSGSPGWTPPASRSVRRVRLVRRIPTWARTRASIVPLGDRQVGERDGAVARADRERAGGEAEVAARVHARGRDLGEARRERERRLLQRDGRPVDARPGDVTGERDRPAPGHDRRERVQRDPGRVARRREARAPAAADAGRVRRHDAPVDPPVDRQRADRRRDRDVGVARGQQLVRRAVAEARRGAPLHVDGRRRAVGVDQRGEPGRRRRLVDGRELGDARPRGVDRRRGGRERRVVTRDAAHHQPVVVGGRRAEPGDRRADGAGRRRLLRRGGPVGGRRPVLEGRERRRAGGEAAGERGAVGAHGRGGPRRRRRVLGRGGGGEQGEGEQRGKEDPHGTSTNTAVARKLRCADRVGPCGSRC